MTKSSFLHKIIKDFLVSFIITYFFLLIPEIILPGIISVHLSLKYLLSLILATAWLYAWLGRKTPAPQKNIRFETISKNILNAILAIAAAMLILSLYKMKIWQIAIVTTFSIMLFVTAEKMILKEE